MRSDIRSRTWHGPCATMPPRSSSIPSARPGLRTSDSAAPSGAQVQRGHCRHPGLCRARGCRSGCTGAQRRADRRASGDRIRGCCATVLRCAWSCRTAAGRALRSWQELSRSSSMTCGWRVPGLALPFAAIRPKMAFPSKHRSRRPCLSRHRYRDRRCDAGPPIRVRCHRDGPGGVLVAPNVGRGSSRWSASPQVARPRG